MTKLTSPIHTWTIVTDEDGTVVWAKKADFCDPNDALHWAVIESEAS